MKKDIIISISFHFVVLLCVLLFSPKIQSAKGYPKIYRVGLVSLPPPSGGSEKVESAKTEGASKKGVAIKEIKKSEKKKSPSKKASQKKSAAQKEAKKVKEETEKKKGQKGSSGSTSGTPSGVSGGVIGSAQIDGVEFGSSYYVQIFVAKINGLWENPIRSATSTLSATVYFRILKSGNIVDVKVEKSSGVDVFDKAALRAVMSAHPLQSLPKEYTGEYLGVHLEFEFAQ